MSEPNQDRPPETSAPKREDSRIIVALDVDNADSAITLLQDLQTHVLWAKIGLELIAAQVGGKVAEVAASLGYFVFWDLKTDDVPRTIGKAVLASSKHPGVRMINVHANSGIEGMMAAVENKCDAEIYAVSELTSFDTVNSELEFGASRNAKVLQYARNAAYAGCDGIICSPKELAFLNGYSQRKLYPEKQLLRLKTAIPGTRSQGAEAHDQKNVETQEVAIMGGAELLVIGSEIIGAVSPAEAAQALNFRIAKALVDKAAKAGAK